MCDSHLPEMSHLNASDKDEGSGNFFIHIYVDKSSIEVFSENYSTNHSCNVFGSKDQNKNFLSVPAGKLKIKSLQMWPLKKVMDC